jgi:hypothetical protein
MIRATYKKRLVMPLFDIFWSMLFFFLFLAWIWMLISVFGDILRSPDLSGVAKAGWSIFIVILPLLGVVAYLIARGDSMNQRTLAAHEAREEAARSYIRDAAGTPSAADELAKLAGLRDSGVLTVEEFQIQKAKLLV